MFVITNSCYSETNTSSPEIFDKFIYMTRHSLLIYKCLYIIDNFINSKN